jgi:DNA-binding NarL/FixJ family response regulator
MTSAVRVVVADADEIMAAVLLGCVDGAGFDPVRGPSTPNELADAAAAHHAQVLVVGPNLPRAGLAAVVSRLLAVGTRTLVVSAASLDEQTFTLLLAGASGFLLVDDASPQSVAEAVATIASGASALHPMVVQAVLDRWRSTRGSRGEQDNPADGASPTRGRPEAVTLTTRELEVVLGLRDGLTNRLLAARLGVAEKTVEAHKSRLYAKLGAKNQAHAVRIAADQGLLG